MFRLLPLLFLIGPVLGIRAGEVRFQVTDLKGAPVPDAVVSLTRLDASTVVPPGGPAAASGPVCEIAQNHREFLPYVTAVRVGATVRFPNRDKVEHHVYSLSKAKKFEFPLYKPGTDEEIVFDQPGVVVVGCNIHDWMAAYVVVLETPWFAVTPAGGTAALRDLAPGHYRAEVWQPRLAEPAVREVVVRADSPAETLPFQLRLKPDLRRRAPEGGPSGYN